MVKVKISATGIRNEYWRKLIGEGIRPPHRYARLYCTRGVRHHPLGMQALTALLEGPAQMDRDINPRGDCDMLKVSAGGDTFYLTVGCHGKGMEMDLPSRDPADDEATVRIFTCMLSSEY